MKQQHTPGEGAAGLLTALDRGEQPDEGRVVRALRSANCPGALVERLTACRWVLASNRVMLALLEHPRCPRHFALDALPRLGWRELVTLANRHQAAAPIRRQAERKLIERLPMLTLGERRALARLAPGLVRASLLRDEDPRSIAALLENPRLTESDVVRLIAMNGSAACIGLVLRHNRWGSAPAVRNAALRSRRAPPAMVLGLLATLSLAELTGVAGSAEVPTEVRRAAAALLEHRRARARIDEGGTPLALRAAPRKL